MTAKTETWTIEADDEMITVPAGSFCTRRIRRVSMTPTGGSTTGGSTKTYWFSRGVGKVREESANRIEELMSFE